MELLLIVFFVIIFSTIIIYFRRQKIKKILGSKVIIINSTKNTKESFLLGIYGIPIKINKTSQVEIILPQLTEFGELTYTSQYYYSSEISIPRLNQHKHKIEFQVIRDLSKYIKEHLQTEREIEKLCTQYQQVRDLSKLVFKSTMYSNQTDIYEKALKEIKKMLNKAKDLEKIYIQIIIEGLIGVKIANYNPNNLKNNQIAHQIKYKQIKDEYKYMKDTAHAYGELIRQRSETH